MISATRYPYSDEQCAHLHGIVCAAIRDAKIKFTPLAYAVFYQAAMNGVGIDVALDDFGIGYSGIQKLQKLNVQKIKVDKSFLNFKDKRSLSILDYVVKLSKDIGISAMVEGVETPQQQDVLMNFGYQKFQGYLYGKPAMLVA